MSDKYRSVIETCESLAKESPDKTLITYFDEKSLRPVDITAAQLNLESKKIAGYLRFNANLTQGQTVLLVYPPGLEFVKAFYACLLAGLIPVPVAPPRPSRSLEGFSNYLNVLTSSRAVAQLTCSTILESRYFPILNTAVKSKIQGETPKWVATDNIETHEMPLAVKSVEKHQTAFLQYTSGSTKAPRGVEITFNNIFVQLDFIKKELDLDSDSRTLFWMPHYHDFSLIGGILNAFYGHHHLIMFSPFLFLKRPQIWFELATSYRATHLTGPNFSLDYMSLKTTREERKKWNLSNVKKVVCSAEPISPETVDRFYQTFAECGLDAKTFSAAYGMAEHTIAVSLNGQKRFEIDNQQLNLPGPKNSTKTFVSSGTIGEDIAVKIVDDFGEELSDEKQLGEIWIQSPHIGKGYFQEPEQTKLKFKKTLKNSPGDWLATGDMGFICEGELVCTGRKDDMMIVRGENLFPQDIEQMVTEVTPEIRPGRVIVFGQVENQNTSVQIVVEPRQDTKKQTLDKIAETVLAQVNTQFGVANAKIFFTQRDIIPKTTSGKLQRNRCRKMFNSGEIPEVSLD